MKVWLDAEAADPNGIRIHFPIEVRWTKEDDIWLSPSTGRETVYIGVVQFRYVSRRTLTQVVSHQLTASAVSTCPQRPYGLPVPYRRYFSRFVEIVTSYQGRPHWAKAHTLTPPELRSLYPNFDRFVSLVKANDPEGMFRNEYVRRHLMGEKSDEVEDGVFRSSERKGV
jgi:L-gulonolactone oxidase